MIISEKETREKVNEVLEGLPFFGCLCAHQDIDLENLTPQELLINFAAWTLENLTPQELLISLALTIEKLATDKHALKRARAYFYHLKKAREFKS